MSVPASRKRKRLLCRFNLHHKWVRRFNQEDGNDYLQCEACGKEKDYARHADFMTVERHEPDIIGCLAGQRGLVISPQGYVPMSGEIRAGSRPACSGRSGV